MWPLPCTDPPTLRYEASMTTRHAFHTRLITRTFLAGILLCTNAAAVAQTAEREVRLGVYNNRPKIQLDAQGNASGILGDLITHIARLEGWTLQVVPCDWHNCLNALENDRIDLLPDVARTPEREKRFQFHNTPALYSWSRIYARPNTLNSILDLQGKTVTVLNDSIQLDYMNTLFDSFGLDTTVNKVDAMEDGFRQVANHQSDAVAASHYFGDTHADDYGLVGTPLMFQPSRLFYAAPSGKNLDLLLAIDKRLEAWRHDPDSDYTAILRHWQAPSLQRHTPVWFWWALGGLGTLLTLSLGVSLLLRSQVARQTRHLKASEERLNTILDSADAQIYIKDTQLRYTYANRQVCTFLGLNTRQLLGRSNDELFSGNSATSTRETDLRVTRQGERVAIEETLTSPVTGETSTFFSVKIPLRNDRGAIEALCGISTDITAHKAAQQTAHRLAYYDTLTELPNRRLLLERLQTTMLQVQQGGELAAVLIINLDHFKRINDARGHSVGDALLCSVAHRLRSSLSPHDLIARLGGDEFAVILQYLGRTTDTAALQALRVAGTLQHDFSTPVIIQSQPYPCAASIGVTLVSPASRTADDLLREADTALHRAKEAGRNTIALYEAHMQRDVEERLSLEHDLSRAIGTDQMQLFIQPQFSPGGTPVSAELLIRWTHPDHGLISPVRFIPMAEESEIILRLGDWILHRACQMLNMLEDRGTGLPLAVNVSPRQFRQPDFVERVRDILAETRANPALLIFEITEGILVHDMQGTTERMHQLSTLGIRFSIDDFGTGYSSLSYLKRLPLYELKIDKSFVHDALDDPENAVIVKLILAMANQLNLRVVAEGVETREQADFLAQHQCQVLQGYLFARPMPFGQFLEQFGTSHT